MSKLSDFALYITSAQKSSYTALDSHSRFQVVKTFYKDNSLPLPVSITVTTAKRGSYLSKDEKLAIQQTYIHELLGNNVSEETANNFKAIDNPEAVATFSRTLPYSEALKEFGAQIVAARMIDNLPGELNEKFRSIRKFDVPASVAISEIPAFVQELTKIYEESTKVEESK